MAMPAESDSTGAQSSTREKSFSAPDSNGYVKTCVIPLCRDRDYESWVRLMFTKIWSSQRLRSAVCVGSLSVFLALLVKCADWKAEASSSSSADNTLSRSSSPLHFVSGCAVELLQTCWSVVSPLFTLVCAFFWVGVYLIRCGVLIQSALSFLTLCHLGEAAAWSLVDGTDEQLFSFTTAAVVVLVCVATGALMVARLNQGISLIFFISFVRTISLFSLQKVRSTWRPYVAYLVGVLGILLARYADKLLPNQGRHKEGCTPVTGAREEIPVFKRRRRSSSVIASEMAHSQSNSKSHRRTSLPCIQRDQEMGGFTQADLSAPRPSLWKINEHAEHVDGKQISEVIKALVVTCECVIASLTQGSGLPGGGVRRMLGATMQPPHGDGNSRD
ncbi:cGMP-inhibited 3'5'-cyclic phosphodiesterase A, partial [Dissostichus eleginoides]